EGVGQVGAGGTEATGRGRPDTAGGAAGPLLLPLPDGTDARTALSGVPAPHGRDGRRGGRRGGARRWRSRAGAAPGVAPATAGRAGSRGRGAAKSVRCFA